MSDEFIKKIILEDDDVTDAVWISQSVIEISRKSRAAFKAAILREKLVEPRHVEPFLTSPVAVIANFPKIGRWTGTAIELCEDNGKAWGQWSVLLRALGSDTPENTPNPEIFFHRRALEQHTRVEKVSFLTDHLLRVEHENGNILRVALLYDYDLCGDDVRKAWDDLGPFDILLKTNPNGQILNDAIEVAKMFRAKVFGLRDILSYLAKGNFENA